MAIRLNEVEKKLLQTLQEGIPLVNRPFAKIAKKLGISEEEVLLSIRKLLKKGIIRRFGASIGHREVGLVANAMVVWKVPPSKVEEVGMKMAQFKEVTHCYERRVAPGRWEYNLFCMVHGRSEEVCEDIARKISKTTGIKDYAILFSEREFKKTSVKLVGFNFVDSTINL